MNLTPRQRTLPTGILIDIPMDLRRRCGRKEIVLPDDVAPARTHDDRPPSPLALAVARAFRWQEMIETGKAGPSAC